mmetsp:Transcript_75941/g.210850  ORF Transcript_75941/g.210850 Transcript_75941/m.210850 type:complete len:244 (+) Transcript_75941:129-860(+)
MRPRRRHLDWCLTHRPFSSMPPGAWEVCARAWVESASGKPGAAPARGRRIVLGLAVALCSVASSSAGPALGCDGTDADVESILCDAAGGAEGAVTGLSDHGPARRRDASQGRAHEQASEVEAVQIGVSLLQRRGEPHGRGHHAGPHSRRASEQRPKTTSNASQLSERPGNASQVREELLGRRPKLLERMRSLQQKLGGRKDMRPPSVWKDAGAVPPDRGRSTLLLLGLVMCMASFGACLCCLL